MKIERGKTMNEILKITVVNYLANESSEYCPNAEEIILPMEERKLVNTYYETLSKLKFCRCLDIVLIDWKTKNQALDDEIRNNHLYNLTSDKFKFLNSLAEKYAKN